jgi:hypothetical protein
MQQRTILKTNSSAKSANVSIPENIVPGKSTFTEDNRFEQQDQDRSAYLEWVILNTGGMEKN